MREHPGIELVIEIHETAVVETARMRELADRLADIGVRFAYDDFGAGQARLNELSEAPPHFVKFDMALVHGLATRRRAQAARRSPTWCGWSIDLGSIALAEGIEDEADAEVCRQMGFRLMQGYLFGKPVPADQPVKDPMPNLPTYDDVAAAAARIAGHAHRTPVLTSRTADEETRRRSSSSSARTSSAWAPSSSAAPSTRCRASTRAQRRAGVVAFSSGNHAQAIALVGAPARHAGDDRHAARRAGGEGRGDARLRRRGRALRPLHARTARRSAGASPTSAA